MTARLITEQKALIQTLFQDLEKGSITKAQASTNINEMLDSLERMHGWADYSDSTYTSESKLSVLGDTDTVLPNDGVNGVKTYEPLDTKLYDATGNVITGIEGECRLITIDMVVTPTNAGTTYIEHWFDIGGSVGELYRRINSFPKGNGVARPITTTTLVYTLDTWEANGATPYVRANNTCDIHDIRFVISRPFAIV